VDNDTFQSPFVCPVTGYPVNGNYKFCALPCGHVIATKALNEIELKNCFSCQKTVNKTELLELNPKPETVAQLLQQLKNQRREERNVKKKKRGHEETIDQTNNSNVNQSNDEKLSINDDNQESIKIIKKRKIEAYS